ncbi:unnamed protein product [Lampetra fluviatilis]
MRQQLMVARLRVSGMAYLSLICSIWHEECSWTQEFALHRRQMLYGNQQLKNITTIMANLNARRRCTAFAYARELAMPKYDANRAAEESPPAPLALEPEVLLLKNSDPSFHVPLSPEDVRCFGEFRRELHVKAGAYAVITMNVTESGLSLAWEFSSESRNVSFSVVWRDGPEQPVESSVVLIPLTRCNSHLQLVQGQLKARRPGLYLLIFDNSFSRFYGKKVSYHLTVSKTLMYDGTDETEP